MTFAKFPWVSWHFMCFLSNAIIWTILTQPRLCACPPIWSTHYSDRFRQNQYFCPRQSLLQNLIQKALGNAGLWQIWHALIWALWFVSALLCKMGLVKYITKSWFFWSSEFSMWWLTSEFEGNVLLYVLGRGVNIFPWSFSDFLLMFKKLHGATFFSGKIPISFQISMT